MALTTIFRLVHFIQIGFFAAGGCQPR